MPIVEIKLLPGRSPEKLAELHRVLAESITHVLEVPIERVRVIIREVDRSHWSVGGRPLSDE